VALGRALMQCNNTTLPNLQSLERNKTTAIQFNDAKKQMNRLMTWANEHTLDQDNSSVSQSDENQEDEVDSETKDESEGDDENETESINDAPLRRSARNKSV
jgi:Ran GTPase-activating protein (RanGAP) involved in mRNA processing and transport